MVIQHVGFIFAVTVLIFLFIFAIWFYRYRNQFSDTLTLSLGIRRDDKNRRIYSRREKWYLFVASVLYPTLLFGILLPFLSLFLLEVDAGVHIREFVGIVIMGAIIYGLTWSLPVSLILFLLILIFRLERIFLTILVFSLLLDIVVIILSGNIVTAGIYGFIISSVALFFVLPKKQGSINVIPS